MTRTAHAIWAAPLALLLGTSASPGALAAGTTLATVGPSGKPGQRDSNDPSLSANGRLLAFSSASADLVAHDLNGFVEDVFVRDLTARRTIVASVSSSGQQGNAFSEQPVVSRDGSVVAFDSEASNLAGSVPRGSPPQCYEHNLATGATILVSPGSGGGVANAYCSVTDLSGDGSLVVLRSPATNLAPGTDSADDNIFVRDTRTGKTRLITAGLGGTPANGESLDATVTPDGRYLAFSTFATNLVQGVNAPAVFRRDLKTGATVLVSVAADGSPAAQGGKDARISNDGSIVAFTSRSSDIVPHQSPGYYDAFVRNLKTGETVQIDVLNGAKPPLAGGETEVKGISGDGRLVIVSSDARHVPGTDQDSIELYLYDTKTGKLSLASVDSKGQPVKLGLSLTEGDTGAISADGRTVAFVASAPNFVGGYDQIYARRLGTGQ